MTGTIKRLAKDKGWGFIRCGSTDYFFHRTSVKNGKWDELEEGQEVTFEDVESDKGPRAEDVYV